MLCLLKSPKLKLLCSYQIDAGGAIYFKFTPAASGNYIIEDSKDYNNGNLDTYLTLLDGQLQFINCDDDSGEGLKASLNVYLEADTTYYIQLRMYSQSVSGNGCLSVWKV